MVISRFAGARPLHLGLVFPALTVLAVAVPSGVAVLYARACWGWRWATRLCRLMQLPELELARRVVLARIGKRREGDGHET